ncbi:MULTISPECIES: hypothetical protein [Streptomyces]|uniref:hypothetical protein n=1 Tax=Streptomyces TaxID=1883 RepID=UPI00224960ED|nr:hypothetical protein [Streptomyces sp. JHD 1]MCX2971889.1 hypothetical protein [Streptomyces sp. JHD 1]
MLRVKRKSAIAPGDYLYDKTTGRVGEYRETFVGRLWLRPLGGGREWPVSDADARRPTAAEVARAWAAREERT